MGDRAIRAAIAAGARTLPDLARTCGAGSGCGGCWPALLELIEEHDAHDAHSSIEPVQLTVVRGSSAA